MTKRSPSVMPDQVCPAERESDIQKIKNLINNLDSGSEAGMTKKMRLPRSFQSLAMTKDLAPGSAQGGQAYSPVSNTDSYTNLRKTIRQFLFQRLLLSLNDVQHFLVYFHQSLCEWFLLLLLLDLSDHKYRILFE